MAKHVRLFVTDDLVKSIKNNITEIEEMITILNIKNRKAIFIYIYSLLEGAVFEYLRNYLYAFTEKIGEKNYSINKEELTGNEIKEAIVKKYIQNISKVNLYEYIQKSCELVDIESSWLKDSKLSLNEAIEIRNVITHNNMNMKKTNTGSKQGELPHDDLSVKYILDFSKKLVEILNKICLLFSSKYSKYTKEYLLREAWAYVFTSPILGFNSIWDMNNKQGLHIKLDEAERHVKSASSSEKLLLSIWFNQYSGSLNERYFKFQDIPMLVSITNKEKLKFTIRLFENYPYLLNGDLQRSFS